MLNKVRMNMNKTLSGIVIGLIIAASIVYIVEAIEEFEEEDYTKGSFFLIVAIAHIPVAIWMGLKDDKRPYFVAIMGTIALIVLYAVTRTDLAITLGYDAGSIGFIGIISKTLQVGIITGAMYQILKKS